MYRTSITQEIDWDNGSPDQIIVSLMCGEYVPKKKKLFRVVEKSTFIPNNIMDNMRYLSSTAFKVYIHLIRHDWTDAKNYQGCFLKQKTLAKKCGLSKSTVSRAVRELEIFGWVEAHPAGMKQMRNGELYEIDCDEYTFFYPVDANGNEMLSPTEEQAKIYRKWKNQADKRTNEEKGFGSTAKRKMKANLDDEFLH